ncbi:hypothetical protein PAPYR_2480 [Paratrimastix pyriformis]|uniref:Thioester reductase (TE) domain-containing protein n=1 Tax=Paratrimastix pyriformis TaxID=342808 RepID=A0ABQ8USH5_9EUKA|nr:hypothetical protein PAPYR_2480 [Paratrimastix pyriformis]
MKRVGGLVVEYHVAIVVTRVQFPADALIFFFFLTSGLGTGKAGYTLTKWVAERLVQAARAQGLLGTVWRMAYISSHTESGAIREDDYICRLIRGAFHARAVPTFAPGCDEGRVFLNQVPVDFCARCLALGTSLLPEDIATLALSPMPDPTFAQQYATATATPAAITSSAVSAPVARPSPRTPLQCALWAPAVVVHNPRCRRLSVPVFFDTLYRLTEFDTSLPRIARLPWAEWRTRLLEATAAPDSENPLAPLRGFFLRTEHFPFSSRGWQTQHYETLLRLCRDCFRPTPPPEGTPTPSPPAPSGVAALVGPLALAAASPRASPTPGGASQFECPLISPKVMHQALRFLARKGFLPR